MDASIGICVYNEEKNIAKLLTVLLKQKLKKINIKEIYVVSSGSTDSTNELVKKFSEKNKKIKLLVQKKREGKASAINLFLKHAKSPIIVLESGDTIPGKNTIERLCSPFLKDKNLGMTGANIVPINHPDKSFVSYIHNLWEYMHNKLPRFGEMIAFRKIIKSIDKTTAVDEAYIEAVMHKKGYKLKQIPSATVCNKGAETVKDILKQRRRVYVGHTLLKKDKVYKVKSFSLLRILRLTVEYWLKKPKLKYLLWILGGVVIEIYGRLLGMYDLYIKHKNPFIWDTATSTKKL
ncbi:MAG: glycosyltransferase [Nanoarchaeota archaeon]